MGQRDGDAPRAVGFRQPVRHLGRPAGRGNVVIDDDVFTREVGRRRLHVHSTGLRIPRLGEALKAAVEVRREFHGHFFGASSRPHNKGVY